MQTRKVLSFGPFRLVASERLLTRDGAPVKLSARALDILIELLSRPNEIVGKDELIARVWPNVVVDEGSLRFHIWGLRRALGDGRDGARYITTIAGRGYCFVASVGTAADNPEERVAPAGAPRTNLPLRPVGMIGREDDAARLGALLTSARFVTIVGAGGIGKTTVAVEISHRLLAAFDGEVVFVDLSLLSDPGHVATTLASTLGLMVHSDDGTPSLIAYLRDRRALLVLDTCEHLIEAVAVLASRIFGAAPSVHILATSREALQAPGEHVYRLETLGCPAGDGAMSADLVHEFPATRLFMERAIASGALQTLGDGDAAIVVGICLKLDGVALAIELVAPRVGTYGLQQTAALLDQRLTLMWLGPRTAPPRQRTLQATLDWSFGLLSEIERIVLRRLAIFVGTFTLDAALAVVASDVAEQPVVFSAIDSLVAKSMIATHRDGSAMRFRLLDTTRAYALEAGLDDAERSDLAARHASFYRRSLEAAVAEWPAQLGPAERAAHLAALGNVRAALDWCFGPGGSIEIGVGLAAAAAPVFLAMSLLMECRNWSERALRGLGRTTRGSREEMRLQSAAAMSLMFTRGSTDAAHAALVRSLAIAEEHGDAVDRLERLSSLQMLHIRLGEYAAISDYAGRGMAVAQDSGDPAAISLARSMLGIALHLTGDLDPARLELEAALRAPRSQRTGALNLGFDHHNRSRAILARTLWLQGYPDQAAACANETIADARATENPVTLYVALVWTIPLFLWMGDLEGAEALTNRFFAHAESHSLGPYMAVSRGLRGALRARRGDPEAGADEMRGRLEDLHATRYELLSTTLDLELAESLAVAGKIPEGLQVVDETIRRVTAQGDLLYLPELMRLKAGLLRGSSPSEPEEVENCLRTALDLSRRQGARMWELRAAADLAEVRFSQNRAEDARAILRVALEQVSEGFDAPELRRVQRLLAFPG